MSPAAILLIRHAEKPDPGAGTGGVDPNGRVDDRSLSVRGWQRAGALVPWLCKGLSLQGVQPPDVLLAAGASPHHPSVRPIQTLQPLAERLGLPIDDRHGSDETGAAADAIVSHTGTVLVCWRHEPLPALAVALARRLDCDASGIPEDWPPACFDRAWLFTRDPSQQWRFHIVAQQLLAGDG